MFLKISQARGRVHRVIAIGRTGRQRRRTSTTATGAPEHGRLRFAICGGGPAGFYAASRLLSLDTSRLLDNHQVCVDLFEALPTPFGLSRYGVAPDHPEVKVGEHSNFRFFGNTKLIDEGGNEHDRMKEIKQACVTLTSLRREYDVVLLAYGASLDRSLGGIPGENELENILPARAAVNWYNGYPTYEERGRGQQFVDLSQVERVTIIGQGNVALDIARILLSPVDDLAKTDISSEALQALQYSRVKHVNIVGRRGPLQVNFTTKEFRELVKLKDVDIKIDQAILLDAFNRLSHPKVLEHMSNARMSKRILDLMLKASSSHSHQEKEKSCSINFLQSPIAFHSDTNRNPQDTKNYNRKKVKAIEWKLNELDYPTNIPGMINNHEKIPDYSSIRAIPGIPETRITTPTDLVLKSLGYRPAIIKPLELDPVKSCARNQAGRVIDKDNQIVPGLYATGWLSRGPNGVIANTMNEAFQTIDTIITDLLHRKNSLNHHHQSNFLPTLINPQFRLDWNHWKTLDHFERLSNSSLPSIKPRNKVLSVLEMLHILNVN